MRNSGCDDRTLGSRTWLWRVTHSEIQWAIGWVQGHRTVLCRAQSLGSYLTKAAECETLTRTDGGGAVKTIACLRGVKGSKISAAHKSRGARSRCGQNGVSPFRCAFPLAGSLQVGLASAAYDQRFWKPSRIQSFTTLIVPPLLSFTRTSPFFFERDCCLPMHTPSSALCS